MFFVSFGIVIRNVRGFIKILIVLAASKTIESFSIVGMPLATLIQKLCNVINVLFGGM